MAANNKISILWNVTPYCLLESYQRFGWIICPYHHCRELDVAVDSFERLVLPTKVYNVTLYRGADKSLARPDWKKQLKGRHFCPTRKSLLPWRPGWTDNLLIFFFEWLAKVRVWSLWLVSFLVGLTTYQHPGLNIDIIESGFLSVMLHFQMGQFKIWGLFVTKVEIPPSPPHSHINTQNEKDTTIVKNS